MTQNFLADLKTTLENCIAELDELHFMFCQNPEADFTGNRKLSFHDYIQFMVQMQSKSVSNEILDFFEHSFSAPTKSAFTQYLAGLRQELSSRKITVNVLVSGYINTKINEGLELNKSLLMKPDYVAKHIVNAGNSFSIVPNWKWKIIYWRKAIKYWSHWA